MFWKIIGLSAAVLTMFGFLPQVIKMQRTKSVGDISLWAVLQFVVGIILWLLYGIHLKDTAIILGNSVTLVILFVALVLFVKYSPKPGKN
ncbi:MAG: SemiSWEET transporter [Candidatus Omnitrophica bacterium]|nr:SemiSWEET transporter [Candidatus Omnitrophota bacterium]